MTVGIAAWATASLFGLHAVMLAFEGLATAVRLAGAAYLIYVGCRLLWAAWRGRAERGITTVTGAVFVGVGARLATEA